jgi:hypothetical protein
MGFLLQLLSGGLATKITVAVLTVGFIFSSSMYVIKHAQLEHAQKQIEKLEVTVKQVTTDNEILKSNNATLKLNLQGALDANVKTVDANKKLLEERIAAKIAIDALAKSKAEEKKLLDDAKGKITEMLKNPANNGTVAPVLRETIRDIQKRPQ